MIEPPWSCRGRRSLAASCRPRWRSVTAKGDGEGGGREITTRHGASRGGQVVRDAAGDSQSSFGRGGLPAAQQPTVAGAREEDAPLHQANGVIGRRRGRQCA